MFPDSVQLKLDKGLLQKLLQLDLKDPISQRPDKPRCFILNLSNGYKLQIQFPENIKFDDEEIILRIKKIAAFPDDLAKAVAEALCGFLQSHKAIVQKLTELPSSNSEIQNQEIRTESLPAFPIIGAETLNQNSTASKLSIAPLPYPQEAQEQAQNHAASLPAAAVMSIKDRSAYLDSRTIHFNNSDVLKRENRRRHKSKFNFPLLSYWK